MPGVRVTERDRTGRLGRSQYRTELLQQILEYIAQYAVSANFALNVEDVYYYYPDSPPLVSSSRNDEFDGPTLNPLWQWIDSSNVTSSFENGILKLRVLGQNGNQIKGIAQPVPSGSWRFISHFDLDSNQTTINQAYMGIIGSASRLECIGLEQTSNISLPPRYVVYPFNNVSSQAVNINGFAGQPSPKAYYAIEYSPTSNTASYWISQNGISWQLLATRGTDQFIGTPTMIGLFMNVNNTGETGATGSFVFFREGTFGNPFIPSRGEP